MRKVLGLRRELTESKSKTEEQKEDLSLVFAYGDKYPWIQVKLKDFHVNPVDRGGPL